MGIRTGFDSVLHWSLKMIDDILLIEGIFRLGLCMKGTNITFHGLNLSSACIEWVVATMRSRFLLLSLFCSIFVFVFLLFCLLCVCFVFCCFVLFKMFCFPLFYYVFVVFCCLFLLFVFCLFFSFVFVCFVVVFVCFCCFLVCFFYFCLFMFFVFVVFVLFCLVFCLC